MSPAHVEAGRSIKNVVVNKAIKRDILKNLSLWLRSEVFARENNYRLLEYVS
jgi:hypothetical protein